MPITEWTQETVGDSGITTTTLTPETDWIGSTIDTAITGASMTIDNIFIDDTTITTTGGHDLTITADGGDISFGNENLTTTGTITGNLTGNVTGNLTGNITGNLTGNVTGNVSGTALSITGEDVITGHHVAETAHLTIDQLTVTADSADGRVMIFGNEDIDGLETVMRFPYGDKSHYLFWNHADDVLPYSSGVCRDAGHAYDKSFFIDSNEGPSIEPNFVLYSNGNIRMSEDLTVNESLVINAASGSSDLTLGNGALIVNTDADTLTITEATTIFSGDVTITGNDLTFGNGATIVNTDSSTLTITEATTAFSGNVEIGGSITGTGSALSITSLGQVNISCDSDNDSTNSPTFRIYEGGGFSATSIFEVDYNGDVEIVGDLTITGGNIRNAITFNAGLVIPTGYDVRLADAPSSSTDAANKAYVDAQTHEAALTQEQVEDFAGAMVATGGTKTGVTVTYQDGTGDMDFVVDDATKLPLAGGTVTGAVTMDSDIKLQFVDSGEYISGDGTDLTIASGGDIALNATDVTISGDLTVTGNKISLAGGGTIEQETSITALHFSNEAGYAFNATTGSPCSVYYRADAVEDDDDKWRLTAADGGTLTWASYATGSYVHLMTLENNGQFTINCDNVETTTSTTNALSIDYDHTAISASGQTITGIGLDLNMNCESVTHVGTVSNTGIDIDMVALTDGTQTNTGMDINCTAADNNYGLNITVPDVAGDYHMKLMAADDITDYATIAVAAAGATTLTTVDTTVGATAHLKLDVDGHIDMNTSAVGFTQEEPTFDATDTIITFSTKGNKQKLTLTDNCADIHFKFPALSGNFVCVLLQDGTGGRTVSNWKTADSEGNAGNNGGDTAGAVRWLGGATPANTETANKADIASFYWDADNEIAYGTYTYNF